MRIAGSTVRRNYLARYNKNFTDKYESEKKIESNHKFQRGSENPIDAAQALRIRKSIQHNETYQSNLKTADTIYTNAESAMMTISELIQTTYEKLVEGAHGTRNKDDLTIIAMEVENNAEEMVQALNIDIAERKVFGGTNNDYSAFAIESSATGYKYVTYNGVSVNSSSDPLSFPYSERSYLDIGIGMQVDESTDRIDDQSAFPITFNGVECTGCGESGKTASLDMSTVVPGRAYHLQVHAGGVSRQIEFLGGDNSTQTAENINAALKEAFQLTPTIDETGTISYLDNATPTYDGMYLYNYEDADIDENTDIIDLGAMDANHYYSIKVSANGKERVIDFKGGADKTETMANMQAALDDQFKTLTPKVYSDGTIRDNNMKKLNVENYGDYNSDVKVTDEGKIDLASLKKGKEYAINLNGVKVVFDGGKDIAASVKNINEAFARPSTFDTEPVPSISDSGMFMYGDSDSSLTVVDLEPGKGLEIEEHRGYAKNIMQLVLDSAQALKDGDQKLVARYADLLFAAQGTLSVSIADLGTHSKFIEFNENRLADSLVNLYERQNELEFTDLPEEITNMKVLESVYNATLQMGANILSQSIFDYIH